MARQLATEITGTKKCSLAEWDIRGTMQHLTTRLAESFRISSTGGQNFRICLLMSGKISIEKQLCRSPFQERMPHYRYIESLRYVALKKYRLVYHRAKDRAIYKGAVCIFHSIHLKNTVLPVLPAERCIRYKSTLDTSQDFVILHR